MTLSRLRLATWRPATREAPLSCVPRNLHRDVHFVLDVERAIEATWVAALRHRDAASEMGVSVSFLVDHEAWVTRGLPQHLPNYGMSCFVVASELARVSFIQAPADCADAIFKWHG